MEVDKSQINDFFRHLVLARDQLKYREEAHKAMHEQIKKVQQLASDKKIVELEKELRILEKKVMDVIVREKKFHYSAVKKPSLTKLKKRILELELEQDDYEKQIKLMESNLGMVKKERFKKTVKKKLTNKDIKFLKSGLKKLERRYINLNKSNKGSKELVDIKKRISTSKDLLKKLKS